MKLTPLNVAIRKVDGPVKIKVTMFDGRPLVVNVQKTSLLESLRDAFDGERTAETGFSMVDDTLVLDRPAAAPQDSFEDADEDLLGTDEPFTVDATEIDLLADQEYEEYVEDLLD